MEKNDFVIDSSGSLRIDAMTWNVLELLDLRAARLKPEEPLNSYDLLRAETNFGSLTPRCVSGFFDGF